MEKPAYSNPHYAQRIRWIDQQLKSGKELSELLDVRVKSYQKCVPESEADTLSCKVDHVVVQQWEVFTTARKENTEALFSLALSEYMSNHKQSA